MHLDCSYKIRSITTAIVGILDGDGKGDETKE